MRGGAAEKPSHEAVKVAPRQEHMLLALALWSPSLCFVELATPHTVQPRQPPPVMLLPPVAVT